MWRVAPRARVFTSGAQFENPSRRERTRQLREAYGAPLLIGLRTADADGDRRCPDPATDFLNGLCPDGKNGFCFRHRNAGRLEPLRCLIERMQWQNRVRQSRRSVQEPALNAVTVTISSRNAGQHGHEPDRLAVVQEINRIEAARTNGGDRPKQSNPAVVLSTPSLRIS